MRIIISKFYGVGGTNSFYFLDDKGVEVFAEELRDFNVSSVTHDVEVEVSDSVIMIETGNFEGGRVDATIFNNAVSFANCISIVKNFLNVDEYIHITKV
jgi:hypothetical protein